MKLDDFRPIVSDAFTTNVTFDIGFEYVDGVDVAAVPEDPDYFADGVASTAGILRKATVTLPVVLPKDAWLTILTNAEDNAAAAQIDIFIRGELMGPA